MRQCSRKSGMGWDGDTEGEKKLGKGIERFLPLRQGRKENE